MNILMLGWEYPPFHSGGLGIASRNLSLALSKIGVKISFALPSFVYNKIREHTVDEPFDLVAHEDATIEIKKIDTAIQSPYVSSESYEVTVKKCGEITESHTIYGQNLFEEIERYAFEMERYVQKRNFHLVHAHDWITFRAGQRVKNHLGIPMIAHVHATEYDRTGGNPNEDIFERERAGINSAERVIAVSNYTKSILKKYYDIDDEKIEVVHNGVEQNAFDHVDKPKNDNNRKKILFLGRLTLQKGPDWFIKIAQKVLEHRQDVDFLIAGTGDMFNNLILETITNDIRDHIHFLGFLDEIEREKAFKASDVYILPSVSEPFGLSAVEAAQRNIPVVLSKQSGAKEVLSHSLSADFWDVQKMADNILALLEYPALNNMLSQRATEDIAPLTWERQAHKVKQIYHAVTA